MGTLELTDFRQLPRVRNGYKSHRSRLTYFTRVEYEGILSTAPSDVRTDKAQGKELSSIGCL